MGLKSGCWYLTWAASLWFSRYMGMNCMGPGRYKEIMAIRSSMPCASDCTSSRVMPADSNWNTPTVWPSASMSKVSLSSGGTLSMEKSG